MGIHTLKIGSEAIIKSTGANGKISNIDHGKYIIGGRSFHAHELKSPSIKPASKKRTQVNKVSSVRQILNKIYDTINKDFKSQRSVCEGYTKIEGCNKIATETHHSRGRRGFLLIASKYFKGMCSACHAKITEDSALGIRLGLIISITNNELIELTEKEIRLVKKYKLVTPKNVLVVNP